MAGLPVLKKNAGKFKMLYISSSDLIFSKFQKSEDEALLNLTLAIYQTG